MVDITSVTNQALSSIVGTFYQCSACNTVDNDKKRAKIGYPCPACKQPSPVARIYWPIPALSLIDLIQGFYHAEGNQSLRSPLYDPSTNLRLATVVFFCSLGEVTLTHLLREMMSWQGIERNLQERLLDDNRSLSQRVERLYPCLTHQKWIGDLKEISKGKELNYLDTHKFFRSVTDARNKWLHQGNMWRVPREMPKQCVEQIWPLLCMIVALHNKNATDG